jgi:hypothetical protein
MSKKLLVAGAALAVFALAGSAVADEAAPAPAPAKAAAAAPAAGGEKEFGNPGVIAFGAKTALDFTMSSSKPPTGDATKETHFGITPQIAYFVSVAITVGGDVQFGYTKPDKGDAMTNFGIGPMVGYNLWLTPGQLSLWPQVEFLYSQYKSSTTVTIPPAGPTTMTSTFTKMTLGLFVPVLYHPVKHFHLGVGPFLRMDVSSTAKTDAGSGVGSKDTTFGLMGEIGGWM